MKPPLANLSMHLFIEFWSEIITKIPALKKYSLNFEKNSSSPSREGIITEIL